MVDITTDVAKVCIMADSPKDVTEEQREAVMKLAFFATQNNDDVAITYGVGLSPFYGGALMIPEHHATFTLQHGGIECIQAD